MVAMQGCMTLLFAKPEWQVYDLHTELDANRQENRTARI
jgi:hypothetical protein